MNRPNFDREQVILSLVRSEPVPDETKSYVPGEYLKAVRETIRYLAAYTSNGPNLSDMAADARDRYVLGYALPFVRAMIPADAIREAAVRWTERGEDFFPRNPGRLLEIAKVVVADRAPGWTPPLALDAPPIDRDDWIRRSNVTRERMGLPLIPLEESAKKAA